MSEVIWIAIVLAAILLVHRFLKRYVARVYRIPNPYFKNPNYKRILNEYFEYYKLLSHKDKRLFEKKLYRFIANKQFIPRQFSKVTDEMRVLIAASAVQLTFGLPNVYLRHFSKIVIYLDTYYSQINKQYHKGEVNPAYGIIVISWKNFVEGYSNPKNSRNLGIHEMAHALHLENVIINGEHDFLDEEFLSLWNNSVNHELSKGKSDDGLFRDYAYTDEHEFFAVAVEVFFENPDLFKEKRPELYYTLAALLNQDPLKMYTN